MKKYLTYIASLLLLLGAYTSQAQITLDTEPVSCDGSTKGKITVTVGVPGNFEYSLDGGAFQSSNVFDNLDEGSYTVTVKEVDIMCEFSKSTTVDKEGELNISVSGGGTFEFCTQDGPPDVTLTASASGGTAPYNYSWPGGSLTVSSSGTYTVNVTDANGCSENASVQVVVIPIVCSRDPNDMIGPPGYGEPKWVSVNDVLPYTIRFENDPEFATAPAQKVVIEHIPDADLNLFSLKLSDFGFANLFFQVPPNSTYYTTRLDVVDSLGVYVNVTAGIDVTENKIFWIFESIDTETGLEPSDPLAGLLPVNDTLTRAGEGFVTFTIQPKLNSQTGDTIFATADIVFDINETIATPEIFNVIDAYPPVSQMDMLPLVSEDTVTLSWTAADDEGGCGVGFYDIYVSEGGAPYSLYYAGLTEQSYPFIGVSGKQYDFFVQAVDNVGNREVLKNTAETTTLIGGRTQFDLAIFLEGAYIDNLNEMNTALNTGRHLLPGQTPVSNLALPTPAGQPYNRDPWNYTGTEGANWTDADYSSDVVDWILVSFRTGIQKNTEIGMTAALLLKDGTVEIPDDFVLLPDTDSLYIVVEHRNHIGVMTPDVVGIENNTLTYDFTLGNSYDGNGTGSGQKQLPTGEWVMFAGDADQSDFPSYDILGADKIPWDMNNGKFDYYISPDFNMDGDINGLDKAFWFRNNGISSRVPK